MSRPIRFSIAGLMGIVVTAAIGLAALHNASETWAGVMLLITCGVLALAVVGVVCRTEGERAWWLGFALFGWGYLALAFWSWRQTGSPSLPTLTLLNTLSTKLGVTPPGVGGMGGMGGGMRSIGVSIVTGQFGGFGAFGGIAGGAASGESYAVVGHCLWALLFAILGGTLSSILFAVPARRSEARQGTGEPAASHSRKRWVRPAGVAAGGLALLTVLAAVRSQSAPGFWAGATFLLTCGLLGITALGAILDRRTRGEIWLGATLFGAGYLVLAFGGGSLPYGIRLPTDAFLLALKSWFPPAAEGLFISSENVAALNARILKALDQPVPMHFAGEATLEDVLKHIQQATKGPDGKVIPIYLDPIGLQEAERSPQSVVALDLEGVPLKVTLDLCLKQIQLAYYMHDGVLVITSEESEDIRPPVVEDPFLIAGHSFLAILAAALGGVLAPLFSGSRLQQR